MATPVGWSYGPWRTQTSTVPNPYQDVSSSRRYPGPAIPFEQEDPGGGRGASPGFGGVGEPGWGPAPSPTGGFQGPIGAGISLGKTALGIGLSGAPSPLSAITAPLALGTLISKIAGQQPQRNPYAGVQTSGFADVADVYGEVQASRAAMDSMAGITEANKDYGIGEEALGDLGGFPGGIRSPGQIGWGSEGWASTDAAGRSVGGFGSNTLGGGIGTRGTEGDFGSTTTNTPDVTGGNPDSPFGGGGGPSGGNSDTGGTSDSTGGSRGGEGPDRAKGGVDVFRRPGTLRFGERASATPETVVSVPQSMKRPGQQGNEPQVEQVMRQLLRALRR